MKIKLTIILLGISWLTNGQISTLKTSNKILISPEASPEISSELINFYLGEYEEIRLEKETEFNSTKSNERKLAFKKDIETIDKYLNLWNQEKQNDLSSNFLAIYDSLKCYNLETSHGEIVNGKFEVRKMNGKKITFYEEIEVDRIPVKYYWTKEKEGKRHVLNETKEMYEILATSERVEALKIRNDYQYDKVHFLLVREIELEIRKAIIVDAESEKIVILKDWEEIRCDQRKQ